MSATLVERVVSVLTSASHAREDVEDLLVLLVLRLPPDQRKLDDVALTLLGRVALRAGLKPGANGAQMLEALARHFEQRPPNEALVTALFELAREQIVEGGPVGNALGAFAGGDGPKGVLGGGVRPAGTVPAGPMARFSAEKKQVDKNQVDKKQLDKK